MLSFLATAHWAMAQDNASKNLVKTFDANGASSITFECKQKDIKSNVWDGGLLRVELLVKANMPEQVLEQLVKAGRYTIEGRLNENGEYVIVAPNVEKSVTVRGKDLEEEIIILVQTPTLYHLADNRKLEKNAGDMAFRGTTEEQEAQLKKFKNIDHKIETSVRIESTLNTGATKQANNSKAKTPPITLKTGDIIIDNVEIEIY